MNAANPQIEFVLMFCCDSDEGGMKFQEVGGQRKARVPTPLPASVGSSLLGRHACVALKTGDDPRVSTWIPLPDDPKLGGPRT